MNYTDKIHIFSCIIEGVKALHSKRICHRNIRPENIGICFEEKGITAKLMNFSRSIQIQQYVYGIELKPFEINKINKSIYTAPEILEGKTHSFESDIWSLGMLFYEMMFGEPD